MTPWTSRDDWLALKFPAEQVAKITGRSLVEVVERQDLLRRTPLTRGWRRWSQDEVTIVQSVPAMEAARLTGRTRPAVYHRRRMTRNGN
jgi:hypothetical protein